MKIPSPIKTQIAEYLICIAKKSFRETNIILKEIFDYGISNKVLMGFYGKPSTVNIQSVINTEINNTKSEIERIKFLLQKLQFRLKQLNELYNKYLNR